MNKSGKVIYTYLEEEKRADFTVSHGGGWNGWVLV